MSRLLPNIIITGTPGCGKTTHGALLAQLNPKLKHISISEYAKENGFIEGRDEARDLDIVDEDKMLDALEPLLETGGVILDWHVCDVFPERLIDLVVVLRCDNLILFDRLTSRGYKESKVQENLDVEIMDVLIQEARDSYKQEIVIELRSDNVEEIDLNVERIGQWVDMWVADHPEGVSNALEFDESD